MDPFGVYLHVPFCAAKCDYCAFATWTDRHHLIDRYVDAVTVDIHRAVERGLPPATSVFVGGGTPSLVRPDRLAALIAAVPVAEGAEITVECNPDDVDARLLRALTDVGVDRVSLGVQSTAPHVLDALGRTHRPEHVHRAVAAIRDSALRTFNLDLIYGAVGESTADWVRVLDTVMELEPLHVSAYALMAEPGTPVGADVARHPDDDDQADKYHLADRALTAAGLQNYEVSNWALAGHESEHNRLYWAQGEYRGFGCAAHSHRDGRRWWNVRTPERYVDLVERDESVEAAGESLDARTRHVERLQLSLRTRDGVDRTAFPPAELDALRGLLEEHPADSTKVVLTPSGRLLANEISTRIVDEPANVRRR